MENDPSFAANRAELEQALKALLSPSQDGTELPGEMPIQGIGEQATINALAPLVLGGAQALGGDTDFAHMDPPTPWITWAMSLWNASLNQNLLHPDLSPIATQIETRVIGWLAPEFGMDGGHMLPGSSVANLTALWAARELRGVRRVVASDAAHLSVAKAAHILGLEFIDVKTDTYGQLDPNALPADMADCALVLTAGSTSTGAIDPLELVGHAAWSHVDAAWAGPLVLSDKYGGRLAGIERADSVAVSAHKWLFQPKSSALILFKDSKTAHPAISFGADYLAVPNIGVLGSHGAIAVPLLATLMAWGKDGFAARIERAMGLADTLWQRLEAHPKAQIFGPQVSGVVLWRPNAGHCADILVKLPQGSTSLTKVNGQSWLRNVAANPNADIDALWAAIEVVL